VPKTKKPTPEICSGFENIVAKKSYIIVIPLPYMFGCATTMLYVLMYLSLWERNYRFRKWNATKL